MMRALHSIALGCFLLLAVCASAQAADPVGDWIGTVAVTPAATNRVAVHIRKIGGAYAGT